MPEFNVVPEARSAPTSCYLCGEFVGPFVETHVDKIEGTVIVCAPLRDVDGSLKRSGCAGQIAGAIGWHSGDTLAAVAEESDELATDLRDRIADLEQLLEAASETPPPDVDLSPIIARLDLLEQALIDALGKVAVKPAPAPAKKPAAVKKRTP